MLSRMHSKLGTAGLVVAIVALVAALGGAAFAAIAKLSPQQKKDVKKIATKVAKKVAVPGPQGAKGDAGATGATGAAGTNGTNGTNGANGANGEPGEDGACSSSNPECTLPSTATETGAWAVGPGGVGAEFVALSFNIPLATAPTDIAFVRENGQEKYFDVDAFEVKERDPLFCTGTPKDPTAPPGKVCVYVEKENTMNFEKDVIGENPRLRRSGAFFTAIKESGFSYAIGTFAVTAP